MLRKNDPPAEQLLQESESIITQFCRGEFRQVLSRLHPAAVWIGPGAGRYYSGVRELHAWFATQRATRAALVTEHRARLELAAENLCVVRGSYQCASSGRDTGTELYRYTMLWLLAEGRFRLLHVHLSKAALFAADGGPRIRVNGALGELHLLSPDELLYAEADRNDCILHCTARTVEAACPLRSLEQALSPPFFFRIHRCYLVNLRQLRQLQRFTAELSDGTVLPIPPKHFLQVQAAWRSLLD
ncbi:MAG: LytTR family DNA-binding domain-containing protein [Eubacteriales bacterium]|nr:LytTR family DNA-binding domain-containing protein [Eubacteriales bacterium]